MRSLEKRNSGFTLIEFLLYLALTVVMIALLGSIGTDVLEARSRSHSLEETGYNAQFAMHMLKEAILGAESLNEPSSSASSTSLSLHMADADKDPTVFEAADGILTMKEGTHEAVPLSGSDVYIPSVSFLNVRGTGSSSPAVRIQMRYDAYGGKGPLAFTSAYVFFTTVQLRK